MNGQAGRDIHSSKGNSWRCWKKDEAAATCTDVINAKGYTPVK